MYEAHLAACGLLKGDLETSGGKHQTLRYSAMNRKVGFVVLNYRNSKRLFEKCADSMHLEEGKIICLIQC